MLIVGGAGFIGSNAAKFFHERGWNVTVLDNLMLGTRENICDGVRFVQGTALSPEDLAKTGPADVIIHLAGASSSPMFADDLAGSIENNVMGHVHVMRHAKNVGAQQILFASTSSIYGNNPIPLHEDQRVIPPNYYSVTKYAQEGMSRLFAQENDMSILAFRFMSVFGPNEEHKGRFANVVTQFMWGMEEGVTPTIYGDGTQTRDFTHVENLLEAFAAAAEKRNELRGFEILNVGTSEAWEVNRLIALLNEELGTSHAPIYIPNPVQNYIHTQQADLSRIKKLLGYEPKVSFRDGLRKLVAYRRATKRPYAGRSF